MTSCSSAPVPSGTTGNIGVKIGVLVPLTGVFAQYQDPLQKGIDCFQQRFINSSSPDSIDFELIYFDNESNSDITIRGAEYLINTVGVDLILGPLTSGNTTAVISICEKAGIPIVPLWATWTDLTSQSSSVFRIVFSDWHTGYLLAKFCVENLTSSRIAVISGSNQYQEDCYRGFAETFTELNGGRGEVLRIQYDADPSSIADQIADFFLGSVV